MNRLLILPILFFACCAAPPPQGDDVEYHDTKGFVTALIDDLRALNVSAIKVVTTFEEDQITEVDSVVIENPNWEKEFAQMLSYDPANPSMRGKYFVTEDKKNNRVKVVNYRAADPKQSLRTFSVLVSDIGSYLEMTDSSSNIMYSSSKAMMLGEGGSEYIYKLRTEAGQETHYKIELTFIYPDPQND